MGDQFLTLGGEGVLGLESLERGKLVRRDLGRKN